MYTKEATFFLLAWHNFPKTKRYRPLEEAGGISKIKDSKAWLCISHPLMTTHIACRFSCCWTKSVITQVTCPVAQKVSKARCIEYCDTILDAFAKVYLNVCKQEI